MGDTVQLIAANAMAENNHVCNVNETLTPGFNELIIINRPEKKLQTITTYSILDG
jgi:hypothetical protein